LHQFDSQLRRIEDICGLDCVDCAILELKATYAKHAPSFTATIQNLPSLNHGNDRVGSDRNDRPGLRLLSRFVQRYAFAVHIAFSLLTGRPVIILGTDDTQQSIQNLIQSLSVFVHATDSIMAWWVLPSVNKKIASIHKVIGMSVTVDGWEKAHV
jgi:hypothetical protein